MAGFNPYYNDNRASTLATKERRFQEELLRQNKDMGSQVAEQSIKAGPTGRVVQDQVSAPSAPLGKSTDTTGLTSQGAGAAMKSAGVSRAGNAAGGAIDQGGKTTSSSAGAAGGIMKGASSMLATGNPYAIAGGAIVGGITGALGAKANRRKAEAEAQAKMHRELGKIEGDKTERLNKALSGLASQFTSTLV